MNLKNSFRKVLKGLFILAALLLVFIVAWFLIDGRERTKQRDFSPPEVETPDSSILLNHPVRIVVHRGATYKAPENTYAAAAECVRLGVDYVEIDVHQSMDGVHYIIHDMTLDRTTNGRGPVFLRHSKYIDQLDAGSWYDKKYENEPVPRLKDYLEWIKGKAKVYLDVKTADIAKLVEMIYGLDMEEDVFFWFWNDNMARRFNSLAPGLTLKMAARSLEELQRALEEFDADMIECSLDKLTPEMVQLCREHNILIMTKGGDNSPQHFLKVMNSAAQLVNLGRPDIYIETLRDSLNQKRFN